MNCAEKRYTLLLVDDDKAWSNNLKDELEKLNFTVCYEEKAENTLNRIRDVEPDAVLLDILFNKENKGKSTFDRIKAKYAALPVIMLTSTMVDTYEDADYPGRAFSYPKDALKPEDEQTYKAFAKKIRGTIDGTDNIENYIGKFEELGLIVGNTKAMRDACRMVLNAKNTDSAVLITGETGTGKEVIAKAIHQLGKRKDKRLVSVNCAALTETLIESELFGHEKGSFTDAKERRQGKFELADKGTIFLDEIGDMSRNTQSKVLRVLQEQSFERVGGVETLHVDVRLISATHKDLLKEIENGNFREDLYYRLNAILIDLPPLRERMEDIEALYKHFINDLKTKLHRNEIIETLRPQVKELFMNYNWPGNIRQFRQSIESAINCNNSAILMEEDFPKEIREGNKKGNELLYDPEVVIERCIKGEIGYHEIAKTIAPIKSPAMITILEGICHRYYEENGVLTEDLLIPVLKFKTRANVHRVLEEHGISTTEIKPQYKEKVQIKKV